METLNFIMYTTGLVFWIMCAILGIFMLYDIALWKVTDIVVKRWSLQKDLFAWYKERLQKRNKNFPV